MSTVLIKEHEELLYVGAHFAVIEPLDQWQILI